VLLAVGVCDVVTGLALRPAATPGRLILIAGGIAGVLVAANPEPARGSSLAHAFWATIGGPAESRQKRHAAGMCVLRTGPRIPAGVNPRGHTLGLLSRQPERVSDQV
jgi:hypothetical protein